MTIDQEIDEYMTNA